MTSFRRPGDRGSYAFLNKRCIEATCWAPGEYETRGATPSGSRSTGETQKCCVRRAYHGCPDEPDRLYSIDVARSRKAEGWKPS